MPLRTAVAATVWQLAYRSGFSLARARRLQRPRVLMLHGVGDPDYPEPAFRAQMEYLRESFPVVPLDSLLVAPGPGRNESTGPVALTFDDGMRSVFTLALPILRALKLPATIYVCPDLIDEGRWLWNHEVRERLRALSAVDRLSLLRELGPGFEGIEPAVEWMKSLSLEERREIEERVRRATPGFALGGPHARDYELMGWDEIRSLPTDLITIGSHTRSHPILPGLNETELVREIVGSREVLEQRLDRPISSFAYPNGDQNPSVVQLVRQSYRSAVTTILGSVPPDVDLHLVPRIPMPRSLPLLAWRLGKSW